jgi:dystrophin
MKMKIYENVQAYSITYIYLQALESDVNAHQDTFASLNETGQVVMADLSPSEVLTALQSKLDDMNDRWNSLNARSVDVGDKLDGGATEWRQLFLDLQEIVDWIERAIQQLEAQKPVGSDLETVTVQNDTHQVRKLSHLSMNLTGSLGRTV